MRRAVQTVEHGARKECAGGLGADHDPHRRPWPDRAGQTENDRNREQRSAHSQQRSVLERIASEPLVAATTPAPALLHGKAGDRELRAVEHKQGDQKSPAACIG